MIDLIALAQDCAPEIPLSLVIALAEQESSNNPYAIGHPSMSSSKQPKDKASAVAIADQLANKGERYDAGLMQISSANFEWLGLTNLTVMEPCLNLAAAQQVILEGLNVDGKDAATVFNSISRYNTGNASLGYKNGYVLGVTTKLMKSSSKLPSNSSLISESDWNNIGNTQGLFTSSIAEKQDNNHNNIVPLEIETNNDETVTFNKVQRLGEEYPRRPSTVALINQDT